MGGGRESLFEDGPDDHIEPRNSFDSIVETAGREHHQKRTQMSLTKSSQRDGKATFKFKMPTRDL